MQPTDPLLFDPDDVLASPADRSLAIRSVPGRPLGKEERAFNRAVARLQALSGALDKEKRRLDRLLVSSMQRKSVRVLTGPLRCASVSYGRSHHSSMIAG